MNCRLAPIAPDCMLLAGMQHLLEESEVDSCPLPPIEEEHNDLDSDIDLDAMD